MLMAPLTLWATTLKVSDNLVVTEINNKAVEHGLLSKKSMFTLSPGDHALVIYYKDVFEDLNFAENRVVKSNAFVAKFSIINQEQLILDTSTINNLAQAEAFSQSPVLRLEDSNNQTVNIELESVENYKIAQQVDAAINSYTSKKQNEQIKAAVTDKIMAENKVIPSTMPSSATAQKSGNTLIQVNALLMLKYWWKNASDEQKENFKHHIAVNE